MALLPVGLNVASGVVAGECYISKWANNFEKIGAPVIGSGVLLQRANVANLGVANMNLIKESAYLKVVTDLNLIRAAVITAGVCDWTIVLRIMRGAVLQSIMSSPSYGQPTNGVTDIYMSSTLLAKGGVDYDENTTDIEVYLVLYSSSTGRVDIGVTYDILAETMGKNTSVEPDPSPPADEIVEGLFP